MKGQLERRYIAADGLKIEKRADGKRALKGYAAVFNSMSENLGGFREIIMPGAFSDVLADPAIDCVALFNHNMDMVLARTTAGSLKLSQDDRGLFCEFEMPDTTAARDLIANIEAGNVHQMSFSFSVGYDGDSWEYEDTTVRRILKVKRLYDVSPVTLPAYRETSISLRSFIQDENVDLDKLGEILFRHEKKLPVSESEKSYLRSFGEKLQSLYKVENAPAEMTPFDLEISLMELTGKNF